MEFLGFRRRIIGICPIQRCKWRYRLSFIESYTCSECVKMFWNISTEIRFSVPFDTKRPFGFYAVFTLQCLSGMTYMLLVSLFSGFYIGMCSYIVTCIKDLTTFVREIDEVATADESASRSAIETTENKQNIDDLCSDMLQFHIDVLKWVFQWETEVYITKDFWQKRNEKSKNLSPWDSKGRNHSID